MAEIKFGITKSKQDKPTFRKKRSFRLKIKQKSMFYAQVHSLWRQATDSNFQHMQNKISR